MEPAWGGVIPKEKEKRDLRDTDGGSRNDKTWETDVGARENEKSKIALEL